MRPGIQITAFSFVIISCLFFSCNQNDSSLTSSAVGKNGSKGHPFSIDDFQSLPFFFNSREDMTDFFNFKKGDVVADIGAGDGTYEGAFSLLTDSVVFYPEDIDDSTLNQKQLEKVVAKYSRFRGSPQTNKFQLCIGTEKETRLPDSAFDKIIMISAFHEFTSKDEMIEDMKKKLKPGGKIYFLETHCYAESHVNVPVEEINSIMKRHSLEQVKKYIPKTPETFCLAFMEKMTK